MHCLLYAHVLLSCFSWAYSSCPSQCSCVYQGRTDATGTRSVLCNDPDMSDIPVNVPLDTVKLRVEKTGVRRIPTEAFYYLNDLRYLWVTYNSISSVDAAAFYNLKVLHELRLDGNLISTFPWASLKEMPRLRTLDLHNNRLTSIAAEATLYLVNITYLDVSSNRLTTLSSDLMDIWPPFNGMPVTSDLSPKVVLGLQDNPWVCDCRISKLIELSKMADTSVVFMDQFLSCSGPENLVGVLFQRAELEQCLKPSVMMSGTKITATLGSNVLLRCDATGFPTPTLIWTTSDGSPVNNTVVQESPGEGVRWSIISLNGISFKDDGRYSCKAKNVAGNSEASITLSVAGYVATTMNQQIPNAETGGDSQPTTTAAPTSGFLNSAITTASTAVPAATTPPPTSPPVPANKKPTPGSVRRGDPSKPFKIQSGSDRKLAADQSNMKGDSRSIQDLEVVEETPYSAVLLWTADGLPGDAPLTIVYSTYDEVDDSKRTVDTNAGSGKVLLGGLTSGTRYQVCLVAKGSAVRKDPCIDFFTLDIIEDDDVNQVLMIFSGVTCAVVVAVIGLLIYKILSLYCKRSVPGSDEELSKDTYVKFETLSMKPRTLNVNPTEMWARRQTQESQERMLLCSRSSIDSQMTYKSDSSRSEFLC
ncbi:leucine-rich repeat, immunoglobulin-like domain and transmembrane domain-containing protein 3a [Esox lucius]|uniref:Ig-like domain-containing protein n=1 Tax=Esox lucius TaxID=8010 RepID=A0A3P9AI80_ESOLU|nr:leucine-rich repeat, immunoglobulin-like domain and transmembrane domain-containing protein 3a [Esox lucius]